MINLTMSVEEVDAVLAILAEQPYGRVHQLMQKILDQGRPQAEALKAQEGGVQDVEAK